MKNYEQELMDRVAFLKRALKQSGASGFVFGNSGGKDSALAGILCKKACDNTVGIALPCHSKRNYGEDFQDALALADQFGIQTRSVDLTKTREALLHALESSGPISEAAASNIAPRLRMTALYAVAFSENRLVVGTGNRSEIYMGYFTKWGDGAYDINPIADLLVSEIYAFLHYLGAPASILGKAPSAGLFEGQTDENDMGVTYAAIDRFLQTGEGSPEDMHIIEGFHRRSEHKRRPSIVYANRSIDQII